MQIQQFLSRRLLLHVRLSRYRPTLITKSLVAPGVAVRFASKSGVLKSLPSKTPTTTTASTLLEYKSPALKKLLPEQVLVYHSGTGRTVLVGSLKLTTIFAFAFFTIFAGPNFYAMEDQPAWVAPAVVLSGAIPMVAVMYYYGPFVNYIHIRLPSYARKSRELMLRYVRALPKDAELDITTMGVLGRLRMSRVKLKDLYPIRQRLGLANIGRNTKEIDAKRRWYARPVRQFGVHPGKTEVMGDAWKKIAATIAKQAKPT